MFMLWIRKSSELFNAIGAKLITPLQQVFFRVSTIPCAAGSGTVSAATRIELVVMKSFMFLTCRIGIGASGLRTAEMRPAHRPFPSDGIGTKKPLQNGEAPRNYVCRMLDSEKPTGEENTARNQAQKTDRGGFGDRNKSMSKT